jgi:hypothetical protein
MTALRKFIYFGFDGDNLWTTGAQQVKFNTEIDHKHTYTLRVTRFQQRIKNLAKMWIF